MKIYGFKAKIKRIEYKKTENKRRVDENDDDEIYYAQALIAEIQRGKSRFETRHNISLYLTREQYEDKILDAGDIIRIEDGVRFSPTLINFNTYDAEKLKNVPAKQLKTDVAGRAYLPQKAFAYHIVAPCDSWSLVTKFTDIFYWQFGPLKIPMNDGETAEECEQEFRDTTEYAFYLSDEEYEKVKEYEGAYIINGYKCKTLTIKQPFNIKFERVENIDKWKVTMTKLEG